ncbi:MAG: alpha/beta fold hydrolase [Sphaerochaetaceae bacterium]|nr:alpha/beta fold hydrolase [Sphaerochaetaceae bacterium]
MIYYILIIAVLSFVIWNMTLLGYRDEDQQVSEPNVDDVFDQRCKPIVLVHETPNDKAVLMIHGFPSTPYAYEFAARQAFDAGYDVFVPLIPGFGTHPKDLEHTTFSQWYHYIEQEYENIRFRYRFVAVIGTSMGGSIALKLGETFNSPATSIDALTTIAAPVFLNSLKDLTVKDWKLYFARTVALFTPSIGTDVFKGKDEENDGDELWIGYRGQFVRAGLSFLYALKDIRKNLPAITCPLFAIHDKHDATVPYKNLKVIADNVQAMPFHSKTVEMTSKHNRHVLLMYPSVRKNLTDEILQFFESIRTENWEKGVTSNE